MLDFRINTFLSVCKYMNFTKASEQLCITQPAVSQHIKYLEKMYNTKFFRYEGKKIILTNAGKIFYQTAVTMKHDEEYLKTIINDKGNEIEKVRFGATRTIGEFKLPEKLDKYLKNNKNVQITMIVGNTKELLYKLEQGEIDFALVEGYFVKSEYDYVVYSRENYICVAGPNYKLEDNKYNLENLLNYTVILREKGSGTRDILNKNLDRNNFALSDFKKIIEIGNINTIKYLVERNNGITFMYEIAVQKELEKGILKRIEVDDLQKSHDFYCIWRKDSIFGGKYKKIVDTLK